ncbi:unnamed protein product [Tenebrio molitor]|nr:unnamed protein product [Tenebrio molitor]
MIATAYSENIEISTTSIEKCIRFAVRVVLPNFILVASNHFLLNPSKIRQMFKRKKNFLQDKLPPYYICFPHRQSSNSNFLKT